MLLALRALAALTLTWAAAAHAQTFTSEMPGPRSPAQPTYWPQRNPTVIVGPDGAYLVVTRSGTSTGEQIVAARFAADGTLLDPVALVLGPAGTTAGDATPYERLRIVGAWTGNAYLVVWTAGTSILASAVPPTGFPPAAFFVANGSASLRWPSVACGATECLAAWWSFASGVGHRVFMARVAGGAVLATGLPVTTATGDQHEPAVAWDGTNYLVAWRDIRRPDAGDIYATRVAPDGSVLDPIGFAISTQTSQESSPAIDFTGSAYAVSWSDTRNGNAEVFGARVTPAGAVLDASGVRLTDPVAGPHLLVWNGAAHTLAWSDDNGIRTLGVSASLEPEAGGSVLTVANGVGPPALAIAGGVSVLAWVDAQALPAAAVFARRTVGATPPGADRAVMGFPSAEADPSVASDGVGYLITWTDTRHGWRNVYATRMDASGTFLDGTGVPLTNPSEVNVDRAGPTIAWGDGAYLVAWQRQPSHPTLGSSTFEAVRVAADGTVLDATPLQLGPSFLNAPAPRLAWNGSAWLAVWESPDHVITGVRVSATGTVEGAPFPISRAPTTTVGNPVVAWTGQLFLVAWSDGRIGWRRTFGARLAADGSHLDSTDVLLGRPAAPMGDLEPALASNGVETVLVSIEQRSAFGGTLYARRFDASGTPLDAHVEVIGTSVFEVSQPSIAWDGKAWLLTWLDYNADELRARWMTVYGELLYPIRRVVSGADRRAALASAGASRSVALWQHVVSSTLNNARAREEHIFLALGECLDAACAGTPPDAGPGAGPDAGDIGAGDAGASGDAGAVPPRHGCGCTTTATPSLPLVLVGLVVALVFARPRRRVRTPPLCISIRGRVNDA